MLLLSPLHHLCFPYCSAFSGRNGTKDDRNDGRIPRANYVNPGYEYDGQQATPMVTFSSNPVKTPGITLNDSSVTQVRHKLNHTVLSSRFHSYHL